MADGPLTGIKVVEITTFQQGPVAGMRLGDLGADVIKIEPKEGDPARRHMRTIEAEFHVKGDNYYFEHANRNKRGIVLDMKNEKGMEVFLKLIDSADVFLNNMSIGAPIRLGIGPEAMLARNPRLIYAQASGWGRKGPAANSLSFDYTGIARSGLMMAAGEDKTPPSMILPGLGDELGGLMSAWGVCLALLARERTGKGQVVDTSLMGSVVAMLGHLISGTAMLKQEFPRFVRTNMGNPMYCHYCCKDGKWLVIAHLDPDRWWAKVCGALGAEHLVNDPRFSTFAARSENRRELVSIFDGIFASKTREEWMQILNEHGCIVTPVQNIPEVVEDPQLLANNYVIELDHPTYGHTKTMGFPWDLSETPASWRRRAPKLGEHTDEVLLEIGYSKEAIAKMREEGAIQ
ncbi:MAG: CoA transferase [Acidobacteriota bacterium]|jgi:crotonobetainyl-CoA:carnitine CoA-transferase CaiB-like acyl-CoA transferase|nr:CoA transferase [Acidobacteriota bacterium]